MEGRQDGGPPGLGKVSQTTPGIAKQSRSLTSWPLGYASAVTLSACPRFHFRLVLRERSRPLASDTELSIGNIVGEPGSQAFVPAKNPWPLTLAIALQLEKLEKEKRKKGRIRLGETLIEETLLV